jgi:lipoprotein-anchoring transpeptidase ErfK/SrfK
VDWYKVPGGYVHRAGLQPILPYTSLHNIPAPNQAFWAEVTAPVAPVYAHCAVNAPMVTRVGNGGVAFVIDYLADAQGGWYAVADEAGLTLGWSQAIYWQPVTTELQNPTSHQLEVDLNTQRLTAWTGQEIVLEAPCSTDPSAVPGRYEFQAQKPGGVRLVAGNTSKTFHAIPWMTQFDQNLALGGVYWHNRFGEPVSGMGIQVTPLIARWLYNWLGEGSTISLV